ncbi:hypothetical protein F5Y04DRAFT_281680 [Hypomontagnella monticulosa]|nr:hypothetical protein F5Y04DRAFT_281680 [Hypomontagnella monticulosa]
MSIPHHVGTRKPSPMDWSPTIAMASQLEIGDNLLARNGFDTSAEYQEYADNYMYFDNRGVVTARAVTMRRRQQDLPRRGHGNHRHTRLEVAVGIKSDQHLHCRGAPEELRIYGGSKGVQNSTRNSGTIASSAPGQPKPSRKPLIFFLLAAFGLPYLLNKMIRVITQNSMAYSGAIRYHSILYTTASASRTRAITESILHVFSSDVKQYSMATRNQLVFFYEYSPFTSIYNPEEQH